MSQLNPLRPHQQASLDGLRQAIAEGARRVVLQAPTGFGKTVLAAHIVAGARAKSKRICFCVPTIGLIDQTFDRFVANGLEAGDIGVIQADHPWRRHHAPIQIATAQTLARRTLPLTDIVVVDECHIRHAVYDQWMALGSSPAGVSGSGYHPSQDTTRGHQAVNVGAGNRPLFVGLSATPWARGMGRTWQRLVKATGLRDLTDMGFLAPCRVFAPSKPDLEGVRELAGDYHEGDLAGRVNQPLLVADIVRTWLDRGEDRPTLCFATGRDHARALHDRFAEFGVGVAYVDADTPREDREQIGRKLAKGTIKVVVNIGTLTTGIDWDVRCIILARPTKSEILFVQIIGRGLRTAEGKTDCLILDHSDTHQRLGFVYDIDRAGLDDGAPRTAKKKADEEREREGRLPTCCPSCTAMLPAGSRVCGMCGDAQPVKHVAEADGELAEFTGKVRLTVGERKVGLSAQPKEVIYAELLSLQDERGRSDGWVSHTYRDIFGVWPRSMSGLPPRPPSAELRRFVDQKARAWARNRKRKEAGYVQA